MFGPVVFGSVRFGGQQKFGSVWRKVWFSKFGSVRIRFGASLFIAFFVRLVTATCHLASPPFFTPERKIFVVIAKDKMFTSKDVI